MKMAGHAGRCVRSGAGRAVQAVGDEGVVEHDQHARVRAVWGQRRRRQYCGGKGGDGSGGYAAGSWCVRLAVMLAAIGAADGGRRAMTRHVAEGGKRARYRREGQQQDQQAGEQATDGARHGAIIANISGGGPVWWRAHDS